jgi:uncharacterized membrane protein YgdD (TMEM256/DUF423 family)
MSPWSRVLLALAGLYGAAGVGLAAWAAHRSGGERLMTAALFLILHAGPLAAVGLAAPRRGLLLAASGLALGAFLFSGDLALSLLAGLRPWPMAAPAGGMLLIAGWLWLAAAALFPHRAPDRP